MKKYSDIFGKKLLDKLRSPHGKFVVGGHALIFTLFSVPLFTAFEAHVVNVTAQIDPAPVICDAKAVGYWQRNEGCFKGEGESDWTDEVNEFSDLFSGYYSEISSAQICSDLWIPECPKSPLSDKHRCLAGAHTLSILLNLSARSLVLDAFVAGADDNSTAFWALGINENSTIRDALTVIESILASPNSNFIKLKHAQYIAGRINDFYESENLLYPRCIVDPDDIPICRPGKKPNVIIKNNNNATVINSVQIHVNTGGNSANGGAGGDGGDGGDGAPYQTVQGEEQVEEDASVDEEVVEEEVETEEPEEVYPAPAGTRQDGENGEDGQDGDNNGGDGGAGGDGGDGGDGGEINTGDASAEVTIENEVNTNKTEIDT